MDPDFSWQDTGDRRNFPGRQKLVFLFDNSIHLLQLPAPAFMLPQPPTMPATYMPSQLVPTLKLASAVPDLALELLFRYNIDHSIDDFSERIDFFFLLLRDLITGEDYITLGAILPLDVF